MDKQKHIVVSSAKRMSARGVGRLTGMIVLAVSALGCEGMPSFTIGITPAVRAQYARQPVAQPGPVPEYYPAALDGGGYDAGQMAGYAPAAFNPWGQNGYATQPSPAPGYQQGYGSPSNEYFDPAGAERRRRLLEEIDRRAPYELDNQINMTFRNPFHQGIDRDTYGGSVWDRP